MLSHGETHQRKRQQQSSSKRRKATSYHHPPELWNAVSKITLTRKALREFDRRTTEVKTAPVAGSVRKTTRLLRSDTKRLHDLATRGSPNLSYLRGYAELPQKVAVMMSASSARTGMPSQDSGMPSSNDAPKMSTTGPFDRQFEQMLIDIGVYPDGYRTVEGCGSQKPENLDDIRQALSRTRPSLSPSVFPEAAFEDFQDANRRAKSEAKAVATVFPMIAGAGDNQCTTETDILCNNLTKFDTNLTMLKPDRYYGARPSQIDKQVRADLGNSIVPSTNTTLPAAPNFFFEGKSAAGRADVGQRQVMYDNAYGARAMFQLQNYGKDTPMYDGNAYTLASIYHPGFGILHIYATHPRRSASGGTEYHMTQVGAYIMTFESEAFRQGVAAYRNAREYTQKQRDLLIADANAVASAQRTVTTPSSAWLPAKPIDHPQNASSPLDLDTSTDKLGPLAYQEPPKR